MHFVLGNSSTSANNNNNDSPVHDNEVARATNIHNVRNNLLVVVDCWIVLTVIICFLLLFFQFCLSAFRSVETSTTKVVNANPFVRQRVSVSSASSSSSSRGPRVLLEDLNVTGSSEARRLRLRGSESGLQFHPALVTKRGQERLVDFLFHYRQLSTDWKERMDSLDSQLRPFGYSTAKFIANPTRSVIFGDWEFP
jgi:hypothetical protein